MVEESTAASQTLSHETEELTRLINRFQVGAEEQVVPMPRAAAKAAPRPALKTVAQRGGSAAQKPHHQPQAQHDEWEEF
jgi:methyl-accepting chemotaxis protein